MREEGNSSSRLAVCCGRDRSGGYSLVELIIASGIMAIVFGTSFGVLGQGFKLMESARDLTRASQILQSEMELLRTENWATISTMAETSTFLPHAEFETEFQSRYTCTRKVVTSGKSDQRLITLRVAWTTRGGVDHERSYVTYYTKEGINDYYYRHF